MSCSPWCVGHFYVTVSQVVPAVILYITSSSHVVRLFDFLGRETREHLLGGAPRQQEQVALPGPCLDRQPERQHCAYPGGLQELFTVIDCGPAVGTQSPLWRSDSQRRRSIDHSTFKRGQRTAGNTAIGS